jgi:acyl-lipid omega-6 desaturase (Delta-12 desaturase)
MRSEKELFIATKQFASEFPLHSWWSLISTLAVYVLSLGACFSELPLALRAAFSILNGLVVIRLFIIYHDYQHRAILVDSLVASAIMNVYGLFVLSPPSVWSRSHDHHHKHNSKDMASSIGSFPTLTCEQFSQASFADRFLYRMSRHPLTIAFGYLTIFMGGMCIRALWVNPRLHKDAGLALALHILMAAGLLALGVDKLLLCLILPLLVACSLGAYLFYAQHNFPGCKLNAREDWTHASAALRSSSYLKTNRVMNWFTGNIGYHHIHHLNAKIPFYRLPEVLENLAEVQKPASTSLHPGDIIACFRSNLWSPQLNRFVSYREAKLGVDRAISLPPIKRAG